MATPVPTMTAGHRASSPLSPSLLLVALLAASSPLLTSCAAAESAVPAIDAVIATAAGQKYSEVWGMMKRLGMDVALANTKTYTLFLPSNTAVEEANATLDTTLALLPTADARKTFLTNLLLYHATPTFLTFSGMESASFVPLGTLLKQLLHADKGKLYSVVFTPLGPVSIWNASFTVDLTPAGQTTIGLLGISTVMLPYSNLTSLFNQSIINSTCFEKEPGTPPVNMTANVTAEMELLRSSNLFTLPSFNVTAGLIQGAGMLPALVQLAIDGRRGVTFLAPSNEAWAQVWTMEMMFLAIEAIGPWKNETRFAFFNNLLKFHAILTYKTANQWLSTGRGSSFQTALSPPLYFASEKAAGYWYANKSHPSVNVTNARHPDLQAAGDVHFSVQGIDNVLLPLDKSLLVPASARAIACPPKPAGIIHVPQVFVGGIVTLVASFLIQAIL